MTNGATTPIAVDSSDSLLDLRDAINAALQRIWSSGRYEPIYERWFGGFGKPSPAIQAMYMLNGLPE